MPKQKDLKRLIRSRMKKTGEAYTAARLQILKKTEPTSNYAKVAGMSVGQQTNRAYVGAMGPRARCSWSVRETSSKDRGIRFVARHTRLVVSNGDDRVRAHSRFARPRAAAGRRV